MSYAPYPAYKDSGIPWLGQVPEAWQRVALKRYLETPITDGPHETPNFPEQGVPFISAEAIRDSKIDFSRKRGFISKDDDARFSKKYKPQKGDIYVVKSGATTGRVAMVETDDDFNIWSPLAAIRVDPRHLDGRYLFHFLGSKCFSTEIELGWSFGTQQNIGMGVIGNLNILLPTLEEQTAIADFLDKRTAEIDDLIAKKEELLRLLAEQRTALITHAVTKGLNPNAPMKPSGIDWLGDVPEGWTRVALKRYLETPITDGPHETPNFPEAGVPFISAEAVRDSKIDFSRKRGFISKEDDARFARKYKPKRGDIYVVKSGATTGRVAMVETDEDFNIWSPLAAIRVDSRYLYGRYLFHFLGSKCFTTEIELGWSFGTQQNIGMGVIGNLNILLPPLSEQREIARFLDEKKNEIDNAAEMVTLAIARLREYRTAIITNAVTGKIKVA